MCKGRPRSPRTPLSGAKKRRSFRLERLELAKARKAITEFGKSLRKDVVIPEKEAPENVIAESDAAIKACEEFVAEWDTPIDEFDN